jgi:hypothetical protein
MGRSRTSWRRDTGALAGALVMHALVFVYVTTAQEQRVFEAKPRAPVEITLVTPPPVEAPPEVPAPVDEKPTPPPPDDVAPDVKPPVSPDVPPTPPEVAPVDEPRVPTVEPTADLPPTGESVMRLKKSDGQIGRVLGTGGPLGPSAAVLEGALDQRAEGPLSDKARAERRLKEALLADLADDEVTAGLTDDYFRELKNRVVSAWRPAMKDLNDGGERVTQLGMMRDVFQEREAWTEMWKAYMDMAKQYATGTKPTLEPARRERLVELMRSRKGMFRYHAIVELTLTQGPDGKVLTLEATLPSGQNGIDESVKDAIVYAVNAMPDPPPLRVHGGASFSSTWRMRASWIMVPPTAFFTGAGFDITPKGFEIDVPFDIKLKTNVMLLRTRTHGKDNAVADQDSGDQ